MTSQRATVLVYAGLLASLATVVLAFLILALLEGSEEVADGPGLGIGLTIVSISSLVLFGMVTCLGTISLIVTALRAKSWPNGIDRLALYVGAVYSMIAVAMSAVLARSM